MRRAVISTFLFSVILGSSISRRWQCDRAPGPCLIGASRLAIDPVPFERDIDFQITLVLLPTHEYALSLLFLKIKTPMAFLSCGQRNMACITHNYLIY
jgi:hypothetical protein